MQEAEGLSTSDMHRMVDDSYSQLALPASERERVPLWQAGVGYPLESLILRSAPLLRSSSAADSDPRTAAQCSAVCPVWSTMLICAPFSIRWCTMLVRLFKAAH